MPQIFSTMTIHSYRSLHSSILVNVYLLLICPFISVPYLIKFQSRLQVQQLIQNAVDTDRLCQMFPGWGAWL